MAIGPEARRMASGRIVVVAGVIGTLGAAAIVLGMGPILVGAQRVEREIGIAAVALGCVMLVAGGSLALRRGPARLLGIAGGVAGAALGAVIVIAATVSLGRCADAVDRAEACSVLVGGTGIAGLAIATVGVASAVIVSRARPDALRRRRARRR